MNGKNFWAMITALCVIIFGVCGGLWAVRGELVDDIKVEKVARERTDAEIQKCITQMQGDIKAIQADIKWLRNYFDPDYASRPHQPEPRPVM